jgi:hypothetical protein
VIGIVLIFVGFAFIGSLLFGRHPSWSARRAQVSVRSFTGENAAVVFAVVEVAELLMSSSRDLVSFNLRFAGDAAFLALAGLAFVIMVALTGWGTELLTVLGIIVAVINEVHANGSNGLLLLALVLPLLWFLGLIRGLFGGSRR